jgi:hypothetical protein
MGPDFGEEPLFPDAAMPAEVREARKNCQGRQIPDFTTRDGREFREVTVGGANDRGLLIRHHLGAGLVPYELLSGELQKEFVGRAFPLMSPEVERRQAIHRDESLIRKLEEHLAGLKTQQERIAGALAEKLKSDADSLARDRARTIEDIRRFEEKRRQLEKELAGFNTPEAVALRRKEMEATRSDAEATGRPPVEPDPAKFDRDRKKSLENSVRLATASIDHARKSLAAVEGEALKRKEALLRQVGELTGPEGQISGMVARIEEKLAESRKQLAKRTKESAAQNDDPLAYDRYCEEHGYPRR